MREFDETLAGCGMAMLPSLGALMHSAIPFLAFFALLTGWAYTDD